MIGDLFILTPDPEGFCNPHDWLEAHPTLERAVAAAVARTATEARALVGDRTYSDPPLEPDEADRCWARTRSLRDDLVEVTTFTGDMDDADGLGYWSMLVFRLRCPHG